MKKYLLLFAWAPLLWQCRSQEPSTPKAAATCAARGETPDIGYYFESAEGETSITPKYVVSVRDQDCQKRRVLFKGCGPDALKTLFGFTKTAPRLLSEAEILRFEQEDEPALPAFSCTADIEPLRNELQRPLDVRIVSGKNGYGALRIENSLDARPTYAVVPNTCFAMSRKLAATRWAAQLEHPEDALEKPYVPASGDLALYWGCAQEKPVNVGKEGWNFARVYVDDARTIYSLRYVSKEADRNLNMLIYRLDGFEPEDFTADLKNSFETQMAARLGIKLADIGSEPLGSPDESTLIMDYCVNNCSGFQPQPFDGLGNNLLIESAGDARYQVRALSNPFLEEGRFLEMTGKRALEFARCEAADDDLMQRLGFVSAAASTDSWENRLKQGAESQTDFKMFRVPCFKKRPNCVRSIPAGTNLSASMSSAPGSISSYVNKTGTCTRASELELHLEGDVEVQGNALTLGNTSQTQFSRIILSGNPGTKIKLNIDCTKITCDGQTIPALQIVPNTTVELKGLRFVTNLNPAKVKTIAIKTLGVGTMSTPIYLNGITIGSEVATDHDFNVGLWLDDATTYGAAVKIQAAYEAVHATRGNLSLIGRKRAGQVLADDSVQLTVRQMPDKTVRTPSPELLRVLKLADVRTFLFAAQLRGPTAMELQSTANGVGVSSGWYVDFSNTYAPYLNYSMGVVTKGPHVATFSFPWVHDLTRLMNFAGSRGDKPRVDFRAFVEGSAVNDYDMPIENAAQGFYNQVLGSDQDICRNPADEFLCLL